MAGVLLNDRQKILSSFFFLLLDGTTGKIKTTKSIHRFSSMKNTLVFSTLNKTQIKANVNIELNIQT